jgi:polyribonucleotide nucleotidyltransferase
MLGEKMIIQKSLDLTGKSLSLETGKMARQADGAVVVRFGDTVVLATVVASRKPLVNAGFFPLQVEQEKACAVGKIRRFFRAGKTAEKEVLKRTSRGQPIRPLSRNLPFESRFLPSCPPTGTTRRPRYRQGLGSALHSDIPFGSPLAAVRGG